MNSLYLNPALQRKKGVRKMGSVTALYLRISNDDEKRDESDSIANQRDLLRAYAAAEPTISSGEVLEFMDDGWSGTNFNRPRVQELLELSRRGGVSCIIVKDLSRWGRNYPEVSQYLDQIFPFLGVRFISVNDHYDSNDYRGTTAPIDVAFSSIMHDIYSKELSVKIRQSYLAKAQKGEYVCGHPPFGYLRSETQKNTLVIDEGAAVIVRRIFDMACSGMSGTKIAATLNEDGVDTALTWRKRHGRTTLGHSTDDTGRTYWDYSQVLKTIRDERYTGTLVCFKSERTTVGSSKQVKKPESEWLRIPGTHEVIVTAEIFAAANAQLRRSKKPTSQGIAPNHSPLFGKIICGHCNRAMRWLSTRNPYHYCQGVKLKKGKGCYDGKVYYKPLQEVVLVAVQMEARKIFDELGRRKQAVRRDSSDRDVVLIERKRLMAQTGLLERRSISLYEDFADGKIDKDVYLTAKGTCSVELSSIEARMNELNTRLEVLVEKLEIPSNEPLLQRVLEAVELTDEVLSLVDCVVVYDPTRIEVRFAFGDTNIIGL